MSTAWIYCLCGNKSLRYQFSRGLYEEMKEEGIVVTAVCPGPVDTEFFDVSGTTHSKIKESVMVPACDVVRTALLDSRMKNRFLSTER